MHVACKGVKGDHEKVVAWYQDVYAKCRQLADLVEHEDHQLQTTLNILKSGLYSGNTETCSWAARLLSKLAYELPINLEF